MMKYTVLTYIFNGYENVHEVARKDPDAEYILVTDDHNMKSSTWKIVVDDSLSGLSVFDKCYQVRFHPFRYASTDTVVRIDGSIGIIGSLAPVVYAFEEDGFDRCLMIHPTRNTLPEEYAVWVRIRGYQKKQAERCMDMFRRLGYDFTYKGLFQGGFEIVRKNRVNLEINDITFDLLRYLGDDEGIERIDQTVTSFVINSLFHDRLKVMPVSESIITASNMMRLYFHNSQTAVTDIKKIQPMLFNQPCKTLW